MHDQVFNFNYCTPTKVLFGKDSIKGLPAEMAPFGKRVLLVYGGGSIKRSGLYDEVKRLLQDFEIFELPGVEPNPRITSVREGGRICREQHIDMVLAVGGGSVLDCSKVICDAPFYDGDPWDLVLDSSKITKALPLFTVLTLAATGSEYDPAAGRACPPCIFKKQDDSFQGCNEGIPERNGRAQGCGPHHRRWRVRCRHRSFRRRQVDAHKGDQQDACDLLGNAHRRRHRCHEALGQGPQGAPEEDRHDLPVLQPRDEDERDPQRPYGIRS